MINIYIFSHLKIKLTVIMSESEGNNSFNENEDDQVVDLAEYINSQNAEIEQANLILEASEGQNCTYSMVCNFTHN